MTPLDPHFEALFDRDRRGLLGLEERKVLDQHLSDCPACKLHVGARSLFELGERAGDAAANLAAIERAIVIAGQQSAKLGPIGRGRWTWRVLLAALVAGGIAAGAYTLQDHFRSRGATETTVGSDPGPQPGTLPTPARRAAAEAPEQASVAVRPDAAPAQPASRGSGAKPAAPGRSAEELFARANQARRGGRDQEAIALYRELQRAYPNSREAQLSQATLARLFLDDGQADQALSGFDSYLKSGHTAAMTEDALVGRATALMQLKRRDEERATWQKLLAQFPNSIHASRARARLNELR